MSLLVCAWLAGPAAADTAADAAAHIAAAKKAFADGKYAEAITEFRAANQLQPDPKLLYSIAQAQRMAGDCAAAIATYEEFIKTNADAKLVEFSQANITRCKEQLASEPLKPVEPIRPVEPVKPTEPVKREPPPPLPSPEGRSWTGDFVGHGLVAGGALAGVAGVIVWSGGRSAAKAANDAADHDTFVAKRADAESAVTKQRIGIAIGAVGVAAIVGGIVHYKLSGKKEIRVGAAPAKGGGAIVARVRF